MNAEFSGQPDGLQDLEARLARDLSYLELPAKDWVPPSFHEGSLVRDVVIIGAGMCGLVAAAALRMLGIQNIICLDRSEPGLEGPWKTIARMETLRSPKQLTGPALGLPSLTFRAWYVTQFGPAAWDSLDKIPREMWMDYLVWYRKVLDLPVRNRVNVTEVKPLNDDLLELSVENKTTGAAETIRARHVVLATGRDGMGGSYLPRFVEGINRKFWAHSADDIDFNALKGKRVGVVGAGASAMDNAATALEAGAGSVDLIIRRRELPRVNKFTGISSQGVVHGFAGLSDAWKWKFLQYTLGAQTPPPRDSTLRVSQHPNAHFYLGTPILALLEEDDAVVVKTPNRDFKLDFVIFATGFDADLDRPELRFFAPFIKLWSDTFKPEAGKENSELASFPYLGPSFEFLEKTAGSCPALKLFHCFNYPAALSHGKLSGDIPAVSDGGRRLARGIARSLFVADQEIHFANLVAYETPELVGDEWTDSASIMSETVQVSK